MKAALGYAALGCAALSHAKVMKWSPDYHEARWAPAQETLLGHMPLLGMNAPAPPPEPTTAPQLSEAKLRGRSSTDNTCAYVEGSAEIPLYCATSDFCAYNSVNSHIGCCPDGSSSCNLWTTCFDSTLRASFSTDNGLTLWCGNSQYPHCVTWLYQDSALKGYTLFGCSVAAGTGSVYYSALTTASSSSSGSSSSVISRTGASSSSQGSSSTSSTNSITVTSGPQTTTANPSGGSTPVGPIVGGVVGGVAVLALVGAGIFFLLRKKKRNDDNNVPPTNTAGGMVPSGGPGGPGGGPPAGSPQMGEYGYNKFNQPPPPGQQPGGYYNQQPGIGGVAPAVAGFTPVDPHRQSMAQQGQGYHPNTQSVYDPTISPSGSPPPQFQGHTPPPQQYAAYNQQPPASYSSTPPQQQHTGGWEGGVQGQQQQAQGGGDYKPYTPGQQTQTQPPGPQYGQQSPHSFAAELPTQRGDGEIRELE
ncbi:hypothetical protein QBC46DRAFT_449285 [Diplogelasinospora grovesii]|uniref:Uncharacterized protein n=1 Tax=Diplogelasinospora grovesii TaxID=303347 RepID=A0AAN6N7S6_9PEZI|nr:hypothetical protein QBC46DRAFT_449285 [Diplogelasinospora grovesii]